jgi:hypothetical protein
MKALTIRQPWIHAILREGKNIENRSWQRTFRGWVALHASARPERHASFLGFVIEQHLACETLRRSNGWRRLLHWPYPVAFARAIELLRFVGALLDAKSEAAESTTTAT